MINTNVLNNGTTTITKGETLMNNTALTTGTTTIEGMDVQMEITIVTQLIEEIRTAESMKVNVTLINGAKKALKCFNEGSRTEADVMSVISALKLGVRNALIEDQNLLMHFVKLFKAKEYISILSVEVKRNIHGKFEGIINSTPAPIGRAYSEHTVEASIVVPVGKTGYQTITENSFAPFVKDFISIKIDSVDDLKIASDKGVYVLYAGRDTMACVFNSVKQKWVSITNSKVYTQEELETLAVEVSGDLRLHKAFVYSPSDIRNFSYACMDVTNGDHRDEYLNKISNGAWDKVKSEAESMALAGVKAEAIQIYILKSMPRFGQLKAGSVNLGKIKSWVYYKENFTTSCGETVDGTGYFRASYIAKALTKILGLTVTPKAVIGMFIQARPDMQKGAYLVLSDNAFDFMHETLSKNDKCTLQGSKSATEKPVMIVDANVVKVESDYAINDLNLELLEIAASSSANLSKQAFEKILYANKDEAMNYANDLGQAYMGDRFTKQFIAPEAKIPTIGDIKKGYVSDIVLAIAPQKITEMKSIFRACLQNTVQSFVNSIDKLKFAVDGANTRLTSDIAEIMIGKKGREFSVVKYGEVYMPSAVKHFKKVYKEEAIAATKESGLTDKKEQQQFMMDYVNKRINNTKICMIKYPSMGPKEYYLANVLTLKTIIGRINNMKISDRAKDMLREFYMGIGEGVSLLPAVKLVMFQCAGLDYDYDGGTWIFDQGYVSILDSNEYALEATLIK